MVTRLPTELIDGVMFFRDDRLREYRKVDDPHECIPFEKHNLKEVRGWGRGVGEEAGKVALELGEIDADDFMAGGRRITRLMRITLILLSRHYGRWLVALIHRVLEHSLTAQADNSMRWMTSLKASLREHMRV